MSLTEADFPPGTDLTKCTVQIVIKKSYALAFVTAFSMRLKFGLVDHNSPTDDVCCQVAHELQKVLKAEIGKENQMGMLSIKAWGSFNARDQTFGAQAAGHAVAVDNAIKYLKEVILPDAIATDKALKADGHVPDDAFVEANKRGLLS